MRKEKEYTCRVTYTEGCEKRLVEALLDIIYSEPETVARIMQKKKEREIQEVG